MKQSEIFMSEFTQANFQTFQIIPQTLTSYFKRIYNEKNILFNDKEYQRALKTNLQLI